VVAARAAAVGIGKDGQTQSQACGEWVQLVKDSGGSADIQSATASPAAQRGDPITVTVIWTPFDLGLPFIPFPGANQPETALARVERLGKVTTGCP
jgi:hypothetical protein